MGGLLAVTCLVLIAPVTAAQGAPWTGTSWSPSSSLSNQGCGHGTILNAPTFYPATGRTIFALSSHSSSCAGMFGSSGYASGSMDLAVPVSLTHLGHQLSNTTTVVASTSINAVVGSQVGAMTCLITNITDSYCYAYAESYLSVYAYLTDATTGSYWGSNASWAGASSGASQETSCYSYGNVSSCTSTSTPGGQVRVQSNFNWTFATGKLNRADSYWLYFYVYGSSDSYTSSYQAAVTGGSSTAYLLMAGPSHGFTLDGITVTP
jgi:hypothetical protein